MLHPNLYIDEQSLKNLCQVLTNKFIIQFHDGSPIVKCILQIRF